MQTQYTIEIILQWIAVYEMSDQLFYFCSSWKKSSSEEYNKTAIWRDCGWAIQINIYMCLCIYK